MNILSCGFLLVLAGMVHYVESGTADCTFDGDSTPHDGEKVISKCRKFKCVDGTWEPIDMSVFFPVDCANCTASDDIHMKTFDEKFYDFHIIQCAFVMVQKCSYPQIPFQMNTTDYGVRAQYRDCGFDKKPKSPISCTKSAVLKSGDLRVKFSRKVTAPPANASDYHTITVGFEVLGGGGGVTDVTTMTEDVTIPLPSASDTRILVWRKDHIDPHDPCLFAVSKELMVLWCPHSLYIWRKKDGSETIGGLCGTQDGDKTKDFTDTSGVVQTDIKLFARTWKIVKSCFTIKKWNADYVAGCALDRQARFRTKCKEIRDSHAPLKDTVHGAKFVQGCISEHCATKPALPAQRARLYKLEERVAKVTSDLLDLFKLP